MSTIAEFSIPAAEFALYETLECRPEMVFKVDRVVAHDTSHVVPFVRATRGEFDELTEILETDASVEEVEFLAEVEDGSFYRMVWTDRAQVIGDMVAEQGATVQEATASDGEWYLRVWVKTSSTTCSRSVRKRSTASLDGGRSKPQLSQTSVFWNSRATGLVP